MAGLHWQRRLYVLTQRIIQAMIWLATGWRLEGTEHVPPYGPLLVVSNHLNNADPVLLGIVVPRPIAYMAKIELFRTPVLGFIIRRFRAFPIDRGAADRQAIRTALDRLAAGDAVGMFPEGTRSRQHALARGLSGVGLLAVRSGAPVLPVGIAGSERLGRFWPRPVMTMRIGRPLHIQRPASGRVDHQAVVDQIMREIAALVPPAYRGFYATPPATTADEVDVRLTP